MVNQPPRRCGPGTRPVSNPPRCVPIRPVPGFPRPGTVFLGTPSGGMFPFSNSASSASPVFQGGTVPSVPIPPAPPVPLMCRDQLTAVPFSVPVTSTVNVSGGGGALNTAIAAAASGTKLVITDSLDYSKIVFTAKTDITIEPASGQAPTITADPGSTNHCVEIGAGNSGIHLKGLAFIGNGNQNPISQDDNALISGSQFTGMTMSTFDRLIVEDCAFEELNPTLGVPGIQLTGTDGLSHNNVQIIGCTFTDMAAPLAATGFGYGAVTIGGFNNIYVQNCLITRVSVARASSHMRGVVMKNLSTLVEDVLCYDLGTGGANEAFKLNAEAIFGTAVGTYTIRNSVAYNCKRWYRNALGGATLSITDSVGNNDVAGIAAGQTLVQQSAGTLSISDSVLVGAGDGTCFTAAMTEHHNDVFNFAATGKVLDATDLTIDPIFEDVVNGDWVATAPACQTAASDGGALGIRYAGGTKIIWCNH